MPMNTSARLRALQAQLVIAVAVELLVICFAVSWWGWWALPFLGSFSAVFTMKQAQQLAAERARIAEAARQHINAMEADLRLDGSDTAGK